MKFIALSNRKIAGQHVTKGKQFELKKQDDIARVLRHGWAVGVDEGEDSGSELTAAQIKEKLTALGIEFKASAKKSELETLLENANETVLTDVKTQLNELGVDFDDAATLDALQVLLDEALAD